MKSFEYALKELRTAVGAKTTLDKPIALLQEILEKVNELGNLQTATITPTTSSQTVTPESGYSGFSSVEVSAVTADIDENIVAGNIKSGVTILGVEGTYTGA